MVTTIAKFDPKKGDVYKAIVTLYEHDARKANLKKIKKWNTCLEFMKVLKTSNKNKGTALVRIKFSRLDIPGKEIFQYGMFFYDNTTKTAKMFEHPYQENIGEWIVEPEPSIGMDITEFEITSKEKLRGTFISHKKHKLYSYKALFKKQ